MLKLYNYVGNLPNCFIGLNGPLAVLNGNRGLFDLPALRPRQIFDNLENNWVPFTEKLLEDLPFTYTYAPRPINSVMEIDYYIHACGLPKHAFIWSTERLPMEYYGLIRSVCNQQYIGRFTFTPLLPSIKELGRQ